MNNDDKSLIENLNSFIEKHSLSKILNIIALSFGGIIGIILVSSLIPSRYYNCTANAEVVADKILACEQQQISERVRDREIELEEYKVRENYKFEKLKATLASIDLKNPKAALKEVESLTLKSLAVRKESCKDTIIQAMCKYKSE